MTATLATPPEVKLADVKWRVDSKPFNGRARFLPYIDAYLAARLLDEWVGPGNWSDAYEQAPGKGLWCHLSIRVGDEWVTKTDIGVPSNMESEKGQVSDAFKRATSLKWGVGGNVYRLPNVWAPVTTKKDRNNQDVAVPNDQTLPAIIAELKKQGLKDAAAADATSDHEDDGGGAADERSNGGEVVPPTPAAAPSGDPATMSKAELVQALADADLPTNGREEVLRERWAEHVAGKAVTSLAAAGLVADDDPSRPFEPPAETHPLESRAREVASKARAAS